MAKNTNTRAYQGLGKFATEQIMLLFAGCKRSKLVVLVSDDAAKAQRYTQKYNIDSKNVYSYDTYDAIYSNSEIDTIYIILFNSLRAEYIIQGAQAGKHSVSEKPMSNSVAKCQAIIDDYQQADCKLMIA